jgi:hypothetical protein
MPGSSGRFAATDRQNSPYPNVWAGGVLANRLSEKPAIEPALHSVDELRRLGWCHRHQRQYLSASPVSTPNCPIGSCGLSFRTLIAAIREVGELYYEEIALLGNEHGVSVSRAYCAEHRSLSGSAISAASAARF